MMNLSKALLRRGVPSIYFTPTTLASFSTQDDTIVIPKRIQRGPTDILRALESTVGRDPIAAHYKYHDDPYLIPLSSSGKRIFAMAQEAGRKAAHWVRKEHADLFQHKEADPQIEAFVPPMIYTEQSEVELSDLEKLIKTGQVNDAVIVYKILTEKGGLEVRHEEALLELLCYQNGEDSLSQDFIEEKWFKQANKGKEVIKKTWKDGDLAEQLFTKLKTPKAYCALIQGMAKYLQADKALQVFEEAQKNQIPLNTNTYNSLISIVNLIKEHFDMRWSLVAEFLTEMKNNKLKPNLGTLNAVLHSLSFMGNQKFAKTYALQTLTEFKRLGIEPSLGSWCYLLQICCRERGPTSTVLVDIMSLIEHKNHEIRDLKDTHFFVTAMEVCRNHLIDVALARRVDDLLNFGDNYNLIGDSFKESVYYRHFFALLCANLPLDEFMSEVYAKLVPHIYVPEVGIMAEVLKQVEANGAVEYVPKLWSDMIVFDQAHRENLINTLLNIMVNNGELVTGDLGEIAWGIYTRATYENEKRTNRLNLTGDLLGKILLLLVRSGDFDRSCTIMEYLDKNQQKVPGVPKFEALQAFVELCVAEKEPSRALNCLQYCADCGFQDLASLSQKLESLTLDEDFQARLRRILN